MRRIDNGFYQSKAWERCRDAYYKKAGGLCERCLSVGIVKAGVIVHHKKELTMENYTDPSIAFSFDNLMLVCRPCHEQLHRGMKRYTFDANGNLIERRPPLSGM